MTCGSGAVVDGGQRRGLTVGCGGRYWLSFLFLCIFVLPLFYYLFSFPLFFYSSPFVL